MNFTIPIKILNVIKIRDGSTKCIVCVQNEVSIPLEVN